MGFFTVEVQLGGRRIFVSQSLSGWDGVFHNGGRTLLGEILTDVAIPFRVGWGFSPIMGGAGYPAAPSAPVAIPFRVGWGFSPVGPERGRILIEVRSQSLSGWDGVFHPPAGGGL